MLRESVIPTKEPRGNGPKSLGSAFMTESFREILRPTPGLWMTDFGRSGLQFGSSACVARLKCSEFA